VLISLPWHAACYPFLLVRSQTLYPTELRAREFHYSKRALRFDTILPSASSFSC